MIRKHDLDDQFSTDRIYWTAIEFAVDRFVERLAKANNKSALPTGRKRRDFLVSIPSGRDTSQLKRPSTNGKRKKQAAFAAEGSIK